MFQHDPKNCRTFARLRQFSMLALLTSAVVLSGHATVKADSQFENWSLRPMCALWDGQASETITRRVHDSTGDVDLRRLGDAIFRMRRARRSCDIGLIRMACQDYIAIMRDVPGISSEWMGSNVVCPFAIADEPKDGRQEAQAASE
jgi:hypothetical protein